MRVYKWALLPVRDSIIPLEILLGNKYNPIYEGVRILPKKTRTEKLETFKQQQKELQRKMKEVEQKMYEDIGKYFMKKLNIEDEEVAYKFIDQLKESDVHKVNENEQQ